MKTITTSSGKKIHIFDDLYSYTDRIDWLRDLTAGLNYKPLGGDNGIEFRGDYNLVSILTEHDKIYQDIMNHPASTNFTTFLNNCEIDQIRVNLSTLHDDNRIHTDGSRMNDPITLLYYANTRWDTSWGGYTLFMNDELTEVEYCSIYKPGRVILFDGSIPHSVAAPTKTAESFRYTFVIQYKKR